MKIISDVIKKLNRYTKENKYKWDTLVSYQSKEYNNALRNYIIKMQKNYYSHKKNIVEWFLIEQESYILKLKNGGVFALLKYQYNNEDYYILATQTNQYGRVTALNVKNEFQIELHDLASLVSKECDSVDVFLQKFLEE